MSVNFSSTNDSLLHTDHCLLSGALFFLYTTSFITSIVLLLPLCIFILYHGLQKWLQKRSTSSASTMSHSDSFTYHLLIMELVGVSRSILNLCWVFQRDHNLFLTGVTTFTFTWFGQSFFQALTCVECYLAAVHPFTYLSLRNERGVRIRNISIGCVWLFCFLAMGLMTIKEIFIIVDFTLLASTLAMICFCCFSVLWVLTHPGPGEQVQGTVKVNKSKHRAFYTILTILAMLVTRFAWALTWAVVSVFGVNIDCVMMGSEVLFNLPGSLVLPLLFLHRKGKCLCFNNKKRDDKDWHDFTPNLKLL